MKPVIGKQNHCYSALIYGSPGVGKSSIAAHATNPVFIDLEDGLSQISCSRVPVVDGEDKTLISEWTSGSQDKRGLIEAIIAAMKSDFRTVVLDTVSAAEELLAKHILASPTLNPPDKYSGEPKRSLAEYGYQKGYLILGEEWAKFMRFLKRIQAEYKKNLILIGHSQVAKVEDPLVETYDRFEISIHKRCTPSLINNMDAVLFARQEVIVREREDSKKRVGKSSGARELHCIESPGFLAKNRFGLPAKIRMHPEDLFPILEGKKPTPKKESE